MGEDLSSDVFEHDRTRLEVHEEEGLELCFGPVEFLLGDVTLNVDELLHDDIGQFFQLIIIVSLKAFSANDNIIVN